MEKAEYTVLQADWRMAPRKQAQEAGSTDAVLSVAVSSAVLTAKKAEKQETGCEDAVVSRQEGTEDEGKT
jgi:hypothetical protein